MRRWASSLDDSRPLRPRAMPVAPETRCPAARDTHPPHFSRLSLRAFVNDAASRAQVDVESAAHDRHRFLTYSGKSRARGDCVRSPAQPPFTHPILTSCVCRSLSRRRRRSQPQKKPVLLSTPSAQIFPARARARAVCLGVVLGGGEAATTFGDGGESRQQQQQPRSTSSPRLLRPK